MGGRWAAAGRRDRGARAGGRHRLRTGRHDDHGRRGHDVRRRSTACSPSTARSARSIRARATATIGGILACGLSGVRRLRHGPVRDHVLEVRFETGDGRMVKGGGPTVKNVTGYDIPRLFVGSLGTIGVLHQATLRCRPRVPVRALVHERRRERPRTDRRPACGTASARRCCSKASTPTSRRKVAD